MDSLCGKHFRAYNGVESRNFCEDWLPHEIPNFREIFRNKFQLQCVICGNGKSWISFSGDEFRSNFQFVSNTAESHCKTGGAIEIMQIFEFLLQQLIVTAANKTNLSGTFIVNNQN